jgi:hypothetical protein
VAEVDVEKLIGGPQQLLLSVTPSLAITATKLPQLSYDQPSSDAQVAASSSGSLSTNYYGANSTWVGEVEGYPGAASSVILVTDIDGGVYGNIRMVEADGTVKTFQVSISGPNMMFAKILR